MDRVVFKYVERELFHYDHTLQDILALRQSIMASAPSPSREVIPGTGYTSDPTARQAIRLAESKELRRKVETIEAIKGAINLLSAEHQMIFQMRYREKKPWQEVREKLAVSERTYFRMRRELVLAVGAEMGHGDAA